MSVSHSVGKIWMDMIPSSALCAAKQTNRNWQTQFVFNATFLRLAEPYSWPNSALKTAHFNTHGQSDWSYSSSYFTNWADVQVSRRSADWRARHRAAAVSLTHYYSDIQLCFLCQLYTPAAFVQTLRETAVIVLVRDSAMAFSRNCPPTHVVFLYFFLPCSQEMHSICKRVWHSNNYSTQWFRSMRWNVVALNVVLRLVRVPFLSLVDLKSFV